MRFRASIEYSLNIIASRNYFWGCIRGALVFLGGAEAPASPSLAPPMIKRHPLLHCVFVHFGGGAMKEEVCLFGLISQKSLTAPLTWNRPQAVNKTFNNDVAEKVRGRSRFYFIQLPKTQINDLLGVYK